MIHYIFLYICSFISIVCAEPLKIHNTATLKYISDGISIESMSNNAKNIWNFLYNLHHNPATIFRYYSYNGICDGIKNACNKQGIRFTDVDKAWTYDNATYIMQYMEDIITPEQKKLLSESVISIDMWESRGKFHYRCSGEICIPNQERVYPIEIYFNQAGKDNRMYIDDPKYINISHIVIDTGANIQSNLLSTIIEQHLSKKEGYQGFRKKIEKIKQIHNTVHSS